MALALRIASAPRCATAYRPSSRKQVVVRAGFCNVHAGLVRTFTPSPYGNKQWAGTASGFNAKISRHATTRRAVNDEAVSAKEATQEAVETVREAGSNILSDVTKRANEMGEAAKDTSNQAASATKEAVDKTATKAGEAAKDAYTNLGGLINGVEMPSVKLSSGHSIPVMGLGTWKAEPGEVKAAVETAIRMGYRHVDCAKDYGNEHEVGEALATIFSEGVVKREELFITSKLWNTDHGDAVAGAKESLKKLQLDYMDLYLIHWPASGWPHPPDATSSYISTTWASMESLAHAGLARSIGVSNLSVAKMGELLKACTIKPSVNQVESHPYWRNNAVRSFCNDNGVHMTAYASLGTPDSAALMGRAEKPHGPMKDPVVTAMAERLGRNPAQLLLRWAVQRGTSVLAKSTSPKHLGSNLDVLSWSLSDDDFAALGALETQMRMVNGNYLLQPDGPYATLEELWDEPQEGA